MLIEPPGMMDWMLLSIVGILAGVVNALRRYKERGEKEAAILWAVEISTAMFVTVISFLILYAFVPVALGLNLRTLGLIGVSGLIAHIGIRQAIRFALKIADNATKE